jgi:hypothetical protein
VFDPEPPEMAMGPPPIVTPILEAPEAGVGLGSGVGVPAADAWADQSASPITTTGAPRSSATTAIRMTRVTRPVP